VEGFEDALMHAAVRDFLQQRETAIAQVAARGIACLDVTPPQLPVALVNRYLELKGAGSL
jgi:uncharacterized protein (DUF58 family)